MDNTISKYKSLGTAVGLGSMLGSGAIVILGATLAVWEKGLNLSITQVGLVSGILTFAIAFGSLSTGYLSKQFGLVKLFNWLNFYYAIGTLISITAVNFPMLLIGTIIMGFTSGADLPVSLSVLANNSPNEEISAKLVSSSQVYWQIGVFLSFIASFIVSGMSGLIGVRIVYSILFFIAVITWIWRIKSKTFKKLHEEAALKNLNDTDNSKEISIFDFFRNTKSNKFIKLFIGILVFYVFWNLLANTWGQFQTYVLINSGASQTQATGLGIILNIITLLINIVFSSIAGGKYRNKLFVLGSLIQFFGMFGMAILSKNGSFMTIAVAIAISNFGGPFAGEAIYKVWTQESFPTNVRASVQGITNGISRLCAGLLALVTPWLVDPSRIYTSMYIFASFVVVSAVAGIYVIRLQNREINN